ncbi:MAG: TetR/AcrR family transcriptional regulator [Solobacterium sp.]|nr:TetR/AcrR family transcriptional regulator [Solobacterium sp.]
MAGRKSQNTRGKIISAAWKLFYDNGYDDTTVEDIVFESGTSKGSFYHYFPGKEALVGTLAYVFDEKYEELEKEIDNSTDTITRLAWLNHELFAMIESSVSIDLLSRLLAGQLISRGEKHLLDRHREYFRLLRKLITEGQKKGEIRTDMSAGDISKAYAMWERALMYDWCLCSGDYSLTDYTDKMTPDFLNNFRSSK